MKSASKFFDKPIVLIVIAVIAGLLVTLLIVLLLIMPKFASYMSYKSQNSILNSDIEKLESGIKTVKSLDEEELDSTYSVVNNFTPKSKDILRFLALNEVIASFSGIGISSVAVSTEKGSQVGKGTEKTQAASAPDQSQKNAQTTQNAQPPTKTTQGSANSYVVKVAAKGFFTNLLRFISNYQLTDRLIGLSEVTIAGEEGVLTATLTVELPLGALAVASYEDDLVLTQKEKDILKFIEDNTLFSASPAKDPLGRPDPFR